MPRPKKIKPIKRQIDFDMNLPDIEGRSGDRERAKKILRQLLESQASGLKSGSKTGSFVEGRDYPEIALFQDNEGFVARPITSEPANYKNGGMHPKKKYRKGGRLEDMLAKYMKGGMMKYENGGRGIEGRAEAPDTVSDLMKGLERYARRDERGLPQMSGKELEERLKQLRIEQRKTSFEGDFRNPNLLFNRQFPDLYKGRTLGNDAEHPGRQKASDFYQKMIDDLTTQAYLIANSDEYIPDYRKGEFGEKLISELESGKTLEQINEQMRGN